MSDARRILDRSPFRAIEGEALYDEILRLAPDGSVGWRDGALVLILPGIEGGLCLRSADGIELPAEYLEGRLKVMLDLGRIAECDRPRVRDGVDAGHREERLGVPVAGEGVGAKVSPDMAWADLERAVDAARAHRIDPTPERVYDRGLRRADAYRAEAAGLPTEALAEVGAVIVRLAVTPAMIKAGVHRLRVEATIGIDPSVVAERVFRAMLAAHNEGSGS